MIGRGAISGGRMVLADAMPRLVAALATVFLLGIGMRGEALATPVVQISDRLLVCDSKGFNAAGGCVNTLRDVSINEALEDGKEVDVSITLKGDYQASGAGSINIPVRSVDFIESGSRFEDFVLSDIVFLSAEVNDVENADGTSDSFTTFLIQIFSDTETTSLGSVNEDAVRNGRAFLADEDGTLKDITPQLFNTWDARALGADPLYVKFASDVDPVPEPATLTLLSAGLAALAALASLTSPGKP